MRSQHNRHFNYLCSFHQHVLYFMNVSHTEQLTTLTLYRAMVSNILHTHSTWNEFVPGISTFLQGWFGWHQYTRFHLGFEQKCCISSFLDILAMANFSWWTLLRQDFGAQGQGTFYRGSQALVGTIWLRKKWKEKRQAATWAICGPFDWRISHSLNECLLSV